MTQEYPFHTFIELVAFDQALHALEQKAAHRQAESNVLHNRNKLLAAELTSFKQRKDDAQKHVDNQELDMKTLDEQLKTKQHALENVSGHKEYKAIMAEIDAIKKRQHDFEDELIAGWNTLEHTTAAYEQKKKDIELEQQHVAQQIDEIQKEIVAQQEELASLAAVRPAKMKGIPQEWLDKYAMMQSRVANPVVPVESNSCSACFHPMTSQEMNNLRRRQLIQCQDCFRLLYLKEAYETA